MMKRFLSGMLCAFACGSFLVRAAASANPPPDERFKVDLLVVVAHPDDETEIGAYLARAIFDGRKRVAVVFGTRGNSGGNAAGQEQAGALGAIREIEAREAVAHFGITKVWFLNGLDTPGQDVLDSLETWDHGDSLGRLVRIVRLTRPSVIATWLPDWVAGENHGDHQAAGVIATEAFDIAGDPTAYAEQLSTPRNRDDIRNLTEGLRPWQPEKIYYMSDTAHTEVLKGKGPAYSATDVSPSRHVTYSRLAAEECAYHLTQGDTGQAATAALAKNDLHVFDLPVLFVFGKSHVESSVTADLFEGVSVHAIPYHHPSGFTPEAATVPSISLGGPWHFYKQFWQAHDLMQLASLVSPEIMAKYGSPFVIPVRVENPTDSPLTVSFSAKLPEDWTVRRQLPSTLVVQPHDSAVVQLDVKTSTKQTSGRKTITIGAEAAGKSLGEIQIRAELEAFAMPQ